MFRIAALLLAVSLAVPALAQVEHCLDQQIVGGPDAPAPLITGWQWAQTFTCEAGGVLSRIEAEVDASATTSGTVTLQLRSTVSLHPDSGDAALLASADLLIDGGAGVQSLVLDLVGSDVVVYPGDVLSLVLVSDTAGYDVFTAPRWQGFETAAYDGGGAYYRVPLLDWVAQDHMDLHLGVYLDCATPTETESWSAVKALFGRE